MKVKLSLSLDPKSRWVNLWSSVISTRSTWGRRKRQKDRNTDRQRDRDREGDRDGDRDGQTGREKEKQTDRQTDRAELTLTFALQVSCRWFNVWLRGNLEICGGV